MVVKGSLAHFVAFKTSIECLDFFNFVPSDKCGGILFLKDNKLGCLHISGYKDNSLFDLDVAQDKLYKEEVYNQILNVSIVGQNVCEIALQTIFGTIVKFRVLLAPKDFVTETKTFEFSYIEHTITRQGGDISSKDFSDLDNFTSVFFNNKEISVTLNGNAKFNDAYNNAEKSILQKKFVDILKGNLQIIMSRITAKGYTFLGWGGAGGVKDKKDKNGEEIYVRKAGTLISTQLHNMPLDVGSMPIHNMWSLNRTMEINPSRITKNKDDTPLPFTNPDSIYQAMVLDGKIYSFLPSNNIENAVAYSKNTSGYCWVFGGENLGE